MDEMRRFSVMENKTGLRDLLVEDREQIKVIRECNAVEDAGHNTWIDKVGDLENVWSIHRT